MTWLLAALRTRLGQAAAVFLALVAALQIAALRGRRAGRKSVLGASAKAARNREKIRDEVDNTVHPDNASDELRSDWRRRDK